MTDIDRIKELLPKITQGEWHYQEESDAYTHIVRSDTNMYICGGSQGRAEENIRFIVLCRNNIAALIEENERLRQAALSAVSALSWLVAETDGPIRKRAGAVVDEIRIALLPAKEELKR